MSKRERGGKREREARERRSARTWRERDGGDDKAMARLGRRGCGEGFWKKKTGQNRPKMVVLHLCFEKNEKKKLKTAFYSENLKHLAAATICLRRGEMLLQQILKPL